MSRRFRRGDVWKIDLELEVEEGTKGHEQGNQRPALIVSTNSFNSNRRELLIVVPITGTGRESPFHIMVDPPEGGLTKRSYVLCGQIRCISILRLENYCGTMSSATMMRVGDMLADLLELWDNEGQ